jgi:hypothetical protein
VSADVPSKEHPGLDPIFLDPLEDLFAPPLGRNHDREGQLRRNAQLSPSMKMSTQFGVGSHAGESSGRRKGVSLRFSMNRATFARRIDRNLQRIQCMLVFLHSLGELLHLNQTKRSVHLTPLEIVSDHAVQELKIIVDSIDGVPESL